MPVESESDGPLNNAASRLDAALDPARLRRQQARDEAKRESGDMPWQRRGVVAEEVTPLRMGFYPLKWWIILIFAAIPAVIVLAVGMAMARAGMTLGVFLRPVGVFGVVAGLMLANTWAASRARRTGEAYAPTWMWAVPALGVAGVVGAVLLGWIPIMMAPMAMIVMMSSSAGLLFPMRKRSGLGLHCARCEYAYPYTDPDGPTAPDVCSECGAMWHDRGGLVRGQKVRHAPWRVAVWALLMLGVFGAVGLRKPAMSVMPTGTLIQMVTHPSAGFTMDEWGELSTRTLSQAQRERLATGLLDLRLKEGGPTREADAWLDAEVTADRLPQPIVDRYHGEMFEGRLVGPTRAKVGEPVRVEVESEARITPFTVRDVLVAFEGFEWSDRQGEWQGRSTMLSSAMFLGRRAAPGVGDEAPSVQTVFEQPGRYRVRAVYWVVFMPQFAQPSPITWAEDGPLPPAGALHMERREVELWVDVAAN